MDCASTVRARKNKKRNAEIVCGMAQGRQYTGVLDSGGLGDISTIFTAPKRKWYLTQIDLAGGLHRLPKTEADRHETAFSDSQGRLFESRAGFGLTVLPAAFYRIVKRSLGNPHPDITNWLDVVFILSYTWEEHLAAIADVFTKSSEAQLSANFAKSRFASTRLCPN